MRILAVIFCWMISELCCAQDYTALDQWLKDHVGDMGGRAVLMIYKDGKIIYNHAKRDMSRRQEMTVKLIARRQNKAPDLSDFTITTKLPIASCTKWLSAALVMTFVDEGAILLSDSVGKYLPVLAEHGKGNITIAQCLSHRTGIDTPPLREDLSNYRESNTMDQVIEKIADEPMEGKPGMVFHYGNTGLQIAAAVIEKVGGKSFQQLFMERIAQPLAMKNTDFGTAKVPLAAGGALSTAEDYLNFLTMILNKGIFQGKRILSGESVRLMQQNYITSEVKIAYSPSDAATSAYGFGEWIMGPGFVSSPGLFGAFPWVDYGKGYAAFLMAYYLKSEGRQERYSELKEVVDGAID